MADAVVLLMLMRLTLVMSGRSHSASGRSYSSGDTSDGVRLKP
jgi:hypothetical protein